MLYLAGLPCRTQEDGRGAGLADAGDGEHELDPIGRHQCHPVASADALLLQVMAEPGAALVEVPPGPLLLAGEDRVTIGTLVRSARPALVHACDVGPDHGNHP